MRAHLKNFFIPHEGNDFHPHILHTKRAVFYGSFFLALKGLIFIFILLLPSVVFVMPDVLAKEQSRLLTLTNNLRREKGLSVVRGVTALGVSSDFKALDMANLHYFSHTSPSGHGLAYFLSRADYRYDLAGENLAMGFTSAEEIFASWVKSPTHYANLVDPNFTEFGVSIESGTYDDLDTVYVAQHFGKPKTVREKPFPSVESVDTKTSSSQKIELSLASTPAPAPAKKVQTQIVAATPSITSTSSSSLPFETASSPVTSSPPALSQEKVLPPKVTPVQVSEDSTLSWLDLKEKTKFLAEVKITGDIKTAVVQIKDYSIPLLKEKDGIYRGTLIAAEPVNSFFDPVIAPSLTITQKNGEVINAFIKWKDIKVLAPTPIEKYTQAKSLSNFTGTVFKFSKAVYLFFAIFFSTALLLSIFVEFRRQHHHITLQTVCLILLLCSLLIV